MTYSTAADVRDSLLQLADSVPSLTLPNGAIVFWADIASDLALAVLRFLNTNNIRSMDGAHVATLRADMAAEKWFENYDPLIFATDELLLVNGQHRLKMLRDTESTAGFLVVLYAGSDAVYGCDNNKRRGVQATHGISTAQGAAAGLALLLKNNNWRPSRTECRSEYLAHKHLYDFVMNTLSRRGRNQNIRRASAAAAFTIALAASAEDARDRISGVLEDIVNFSCKDEASRAIAKLLDSGDGNTGRPDRADEALKILQGLNMLLRGIPRSILRPTTDGLLRFVPNAQYRAKAVSPQLGGPRRGISGKDAADVAD